jgi:hypothetical protein
MSRCRTSYDDKVYTRDPWVYIGFEGNEMVENSEENSLIGKKRKAGDNANNTNNSNIEKFPQKNKPSENLAMPVKPDNPAKPGESKKPKKKSPEKTIKKQEKVITKKTVSDLDIFNNDFNIEVSLKKKVDVIYKQKLEKFKSTYLEFVTKRNTQFPKLEKLDIVYFNNNLEKLFKLYQFVKENGGIEEGIFYLI